MKYLFVALLLSFYSCTKQTAIKELEGSYDVQGYKVRCTYFGCDSIKINSTLNLKFKSENTRIAVTLFNSSQDKNENISTLALDKIDKREITMSLSKNYGVFNRYNKNLIYVNANNWSEYIPNLTDTASNYYYLKGVKQ